MSDDKNISRIKGANVGVCLSSGFFGFYHHTGVLAALVENSIRPKSITGTSAGALVASMYAAGLEPKEIRDHLVGLRREDFWDVQFPFTSAGMGLLAGEGFKRELGRALPVHSFSDLRIPLSMGVYNLKTGRVEHISSDPLAEAVYASCALPYLFRPSRLHGGKYWDGGFGEKSPLVPFLEQPDIDTVVLSYIPRHEGKKLNVPLLGDFFPPPSALFAYSPPEERLERDRASVEALRRAGKDVLVLSPDRVSLGPFTMERGNEAFVRGLEGTREILHSTEETLGSAELCSG